MPLRSRVLCLLAAVLVPANVACARSAPPETCTGQTVRLVREDVLTFGTDFAYPPFAFDDPETGNPSGFEVELGEAIAKQLGVKLLLVNRTPGALIPGLLAHRHDLAASALLSTPNVRREVCVSSPYLDADLGLAARPGLAPSVQGVGDLEGRAVGVVEGSRAERWARSELPETARVVRVAASDDLLPILRAKQVDAVVDDLPVLRHQQVRFADVSVVAPIETGENYVLAAGPDNRGLIDAVNEALRRLHANGTIAALEGKWFGA